MPHLYSHQVKKGSRHKAVMSVYKPITYVTLLAINFFLTISPALAQYQIEIPLIGGGKQVSGPADYIKTFFVFGLMLVGVTALFAIVLGGFIYLLAGASETRKTHGKEWIWGGVSGLLLLLCAYLILFTINPELTILKEPRLEKIAIVSEWWEGKQQEEEPEELEETEEVPEEADAGSQDIIDLTNCIAGIVPPSGYSRAPYVDSNIANCAPCRNFCSGCNHACFSDHYGCRCGDGLSHAVDLSTTDPNLQCQLAQAAQTCAGQIGVSTRVVYGSNTAARQCPQYIRPYAGHENHIHISLNCR